MKCLLFLHKWEYDTCFLTGVDVKVCRNCGKVVEL